MLEDLACVLFLSNILILLIYGNIAALLRAITRGNNFENTVTFYKLLLRHAKEKQNLEMESVTVWRLQKCYIRLYAMMLKQSSTNQPTLPAYSVSCQS